MLACSLLGPCRPPGTEAAWGRAELGIDVRVILQRSLAVLTGRLGSAHMADLDMGGPLAYALLLASVHLLVKPSKAVIHFFILSGRQHKGDFVSCAPTLSFLL